MNDYKISPDCVIVKGVFSSVIMDLKRQKYYSIPTEIDPLKDEDVKQNLIDEEILLNIKDLEILPLFNDFDKPTVIDVLLINKFYNPDKIVKTVSKFRINRIGILIDFDKIHEITKILHELKNFDIETVEIFIEMTEINNKILNSFEKIIDDFPFVFFNTFTKRINTKERNLVQIRIIESDFTFNWRKFNETFFVNFDFYFEALNKNIAFNKRLFLDENGDFYESFHKSIFLGHDIEIEDLKRFDELWGVSKDKIDVCNKCEFRYMCLDFRLPIKRNDSSWYYEKECFYNPFISKWMNEVGYHTLTDCHVIVNQNEFSINEKKINEINKCLYED